MIYSFRVNIIVRVLILLILVAASVLSFVKGFYLTTGFTMVLLTFAVISLIRYVNQTNRDLANFFTSVNYNDFTATVSAGHKGSSFGELYRGFNMISRKFQDIRAEKEANHQFLQTLVEHVDIGLLCVNEKEEVVLMNKALQRLLHKSYLMKLSNLQQVDEELYEAVQQLTPGQTELVKLIIDNKVVQLILRAVTLKQNKSMLRLISFQNIQSELEGQELVAWQKLIRILTHEIMNSVAPIASLSSTVSDVIGDKEEVEPDTLKMIHNSVGVIHRRSEGLLSFTETYRRLTRIPPPKFEHIEGKKMMEHLYTLYQPDLAARQINLRLHLPPHEVVFQGDPNLLEQVLINLVKNSADALEGRPNPTIDIYLKRDLEGRVIMQISDNGSGISEEMLEQIFVPFFTTKETGSGIGLSLSRQILQLHRGTIEVQSKEGAGTVVSLIL